MTFYVEGKIHFNGTCFHIVSSVNRPKQVYQKLEYVQHDVKNYYEISFLFSNSYKKNVTNDLPKNRSSKLICSILINLK